MSIQKQKKFQFTKFNMETLKDFELIKQGAEAKVYVGKYQIDEDNNQNIIIKERFKKTYRHPELDKSLTAKRIKNEVKLLEKAKLIDVNVPKVIKADLANGVICMEYIDNSLTCRDFIIKIVKEKEESVHKALLNDIALKIGQIIGKLHFNEIIHGDLTTSNMLIDLGSITEDSHENVKIVFIDFGLSSITNQLEEKAVDLYVLERALLSTHSIQAKDIFEYILKGYMIGHEKDADKVMDRFEAVRLRGRKRTMIG